MLERKTLTNLEIFNIANNLMESFSLDSEANFPVKVNFYLQKNINTIVEMAREIEKSRVAIIQKYGTPSEGNPDQYEVAPDLIETANQELKDLFDLEQEVPVQMLKLDWFDNVDLSMSQVKAISIMIEE